MNRIVPTLLAAGILALGLTACGPAPADPCTTTMPAPTQVQIDKVNRGLEVDESIEVNGSEVECVLTERRDGSFVWLSEVDD